MRQNNQFKMSTVRYVVSSPSEGATLWLITLDHLTTYCTNSSGHSYQKNTVRAWKTFWLKLIFLKFYNEDYQCHFSGVQIAKKIPTLPIYSCKCSKSMMAWKCSIVWSLFSVQNWRITEIQTKKTARFCFIAECFLQSRFSPILGTQCQCPFRSPHTMSSFETRYSKYFFFSIRAYGVEELCS